MSLIVAARFDSFPEAQTAGRRLSEAGFSREDLSIFFVNPAGQHDRYPVGGDQAVDPGSRQARTGALAGAFLVGLGGAAIGAALWRYGGGPAWVLPLAAGVGAYIGSLGGALAVTRGVVRRAQPGRSTGMRRAGVLTAVHVTRYTEAEAARLLRNSGGRDVEKAEGEWRDGDWVDFDPVAPPVLTDKIEPDVRDPDESTGHRILRERTEHGE